MKSEFQTRVKDLVSATQLKAALELLKPIVLNTNYENPFRMINSKLVGYNNDVIGGMVSRTELTQDYRSISNSILLFVDNLPAYYFNDIDLDKNDLHEPYKPGGFPKPRPTLEETFPNTPKPSFSDFISQSAPVEVLSRQSCIQWARKIRRRDADLHKDFKSLAEAVLEYQDKKTDHPSYDASGRSFKRLNKQYLELVEKAKDILEDKNFSTIESIQALLLDEIPSKSNLKKAVQLLKSKLPSHNFDNTEALLKGSVNDSVKMDIAEELEELLLKVE